MLLAVFRVLALAASSSARAAGSFGRHQAAAYLTASVRRGNLVVSVSSPGPVTSPNNLPLTFKNTGKLLGLDDCARARRIPASR